MPLHSYALLKGRACAKHASTQGHPHYHVLVEAAGKPYRVAVNVRSMLQPSEMAYVLKIRFRHPICQRLHDLSPGLHAIEPGPEGLGLDYIRLNLFHRDQILVLPCNGPGCGADLNEVLDGVVCAAISDPAAQLYVFGEPWEAVNASDRIFRFHPSRGMHEVHMNQGNDPSHWNQDGVWQDGGILIEHPAMHRWTALFLKFQSQSWHTDDETGHALTAPNGMPFVPRDVNGHQRPDGMVRIVAAYVNPLSENAPQRVTLLNCCPFPVDLDGWSIADHAKRRWRLHGEIEAGRTLDIGLGSSISLGHEGGIITLLNEDGYKVHGVSYTAEQAGKAGWLVTFG